MGKYLRGLLPIPAQYHNQKPRLLTRKAEKRNCAMLMEAETGEWRVESVWWSHSWEPRIKWRGGFLPRDVTTFAFIQRRLFLYLHSDLLLGGRASGKITYRNTAWYVWITSILNVLEDKKSHNFQALTFLTPMLQVCVVSSFSVAGTCDCEARHVDGLFREWWPSDDCFSDSRSRGTGQESRQATQCANKQS